MRFKLAGYSLLLLSTLGCNTPALAESPPPLDFIELLGEMDDDSMLEVALAELEQAKPKKASAIKQSNKQNSDMAASAGDQKK